MAAAAPDRLTAVTAASGVALALRGYTPRAALATLAGVELLGQIVGDADEKKPLAKCALDVAVGLSAWWLARAAAGP